MKNQAKIGVFNRLAALFCVIEVAVLIGIVLLILRYAYIQEKSDTSTLDERTAQVMENIDQQIKSVYDIEDNLFSDTRLGQIAFKMYPDNYEKSRLFLGIVGSIKNIQSLNPMIADISVTFPGESVELTASNGYGRKEYNSEEPLGVKLNDYLYISDNSLRMRFQYPFALIEGEQPDYVSSIRFVDTFFDPYLNMFQENNRSGAMLILKDSSGQLHTLYGDEEYRDMLLGQWEEYLARGGQESKYQTEKTIGGGEYHLSYVESSRYPVVLAAYRYNNVISRNMANTLLIISVVILVNIAFITTIILQANRTVVRPFYKLMDGFQQVGKGNLSTRIHHNKNDEFQFMYASFNDMTESMGQMVLDIKEQQKLVANAEFQQLQAQINPHFLYNSFFMIKYMVRNGEYEQTEKMVTTLAEYYRFINKEVDHLIPLQEEVRHMDSFIYIQQLRFSERITVEKGELPRELANCRVPKLILQPLIENAYQYGVKNLLSDGLIRITFEQEGQMLYIHVEDNGREIDPEKLVSLQKQVNSEEEKDIRHALTNIRRRLMLAYRDPNALTLSIGELGGLRVTIRLELDGPVYEPIL